MIEGMRTGTVDSLAREHGVELLRFAYLLCGNRQLAEDLLQDVLLALHRRYPDGLAALDNPVGYARRALANTNVSRARRRASSELVIDELPVIAVLDPDDPADRDALWQALRRLPVRQRTVLVLRFYADWTDEDIAAALGARRGTVRSLASRALVALRADGTLTHSDSDSEGGRS